MFPEEKVKLLQTKINHTIGLVEQLIQNNGDEINRLELHMEEMLNPSDQSNVPIFGYMMEKYVEQIKLKHMNNNFEMIIGFSKLSPQFRYII